MNTPIFVIIQNHINNTNPLPPICFQDRLSYDLLVSKTLYDKGIAVKEITKEEVFLCMSRMCIEYAIGCYIKDGDSTQNRKRLATEAMISFIETMGKGFVHEPYAIEIPSLGSIKSYIKSLH